MINTDELLEEPLKLVDTTEEKKKPKIKKVEKSVLSFVAERRIISEDCIALEKGVTNFYRIQVFRLICLKTLSMQPDGLKWVH